MDKSKCVCVCARVRFFTADFSIFWAIYTAHIHKHALASFANVNKSVFMC